MLRIWNALGGAWNQVEDGTKQSARIPVESKHVKPRAFSLNLHKICMKILLQQCHSHDLQQTDIRKAVQTETSWFSVP